MKNIIITGPSRAGKSTLAKKINEKLNYFVISLDKLVAAFQGAYPRLDIRLNWDREKTAKNLAPFLGHCLGLFSAPGGRGLLPYSHGAAEGNRFVLEGGYFDLEQISLILKMYGINELKDEFLLIGLTQNNKTTEEFIDDFKKYDTEDDWTYRFSDDDLREIAEDAISLGKSMSRHLTRYGFTVYDTSRNREFVLDQIVEEIKEKLKA